MLSPTKGSLPRALEAVSRALYRADPATGLHSQRVARLSRDVARELGLGPREVAIAYAGGLVHDAGKLLTPRHLLRAPRPLTSPERGVVQLHSEAGDALLRRMGVPWEVRMHALFHHRHIDGSGYPHVATGTDLPLAVRIVSAVDYYEAVRGQRPYREPVGHREAIDMLRQAGAGHLDSTVIDAIDALGTRIPGWFEGARPDLR